jgi:tight adherence protein C
VRRALPDVVDLLRLAVAGGATVQLGLLAVHRHVDGIVGVAVGDAIAAIEAGSPIADEIERLRDALGPSSHSLVALLRASLLDGAPLAPALDRLADELRADRRRHAEAAARRLPVRLLFPLVCCALPALVLLSVVPLLVGTFRLLRL